MSVVIGLTNLEQGIILSDINKPDFEENVLEEEVPFVDILILTQS